MLTKSLPINIYSKYGDVEKTFRNWFKFNYRGNSKINNDPEEFKEQDHNLKSYAKITKEDEEII